MSAVLELSSFLSPSSARLTLDLDLPALTTEPRPSISQADDLADVSVCLCHVYHVGLVFSLLHCGE